MLHYTRPNLCIQLMFTYTYSYGCYVSMFAFYVSWITMVHQCSFGGWYWERVTKWTFIFGPNNKGARWDTRLVTSYIQFYYYTNLISGPIRPLFFRLVVDFNFFRFKLYSCECVEYQIVYIHKYLLCVVWRMCKLNPGIMFQFSLTLSHILS